MKKLFVLMILGFMCAGIAVSQEYKPKAGNVAVEFNFTPLSGTPIGLNYLKTRFFIADDLVFRMGLDVRMHSAKSEPKTGTVTDEEKMSYTQFGLFPGIEKHFGNSDRVSPYIGAEIGFTTKSTKYEYTDNSATPAVTTEFSGAWDAAGTERAFSAFGVNAVAGADFYFAKKIYLGAELGLGFQSTTLKEVEQTVGSTKNVVLVKGSQTDVGFNFNPAIRLGFCF